MMDMIQALRPSCRILFILSKKHIERDFAVPLPSPRKNLTTKSIFLGPSRVCESLRPPYLQPQPRLQTPPLSVADATTC